MQLSLSQIPLQVYAVLVLCVVVWVWLKKRGAGTAPYDRKDPRSLLADSDSYGSYGYPPPQQKSSSNLTLIVLILLLIVILYLTWPILSKSVYLPAFQGVTQQLTSKRTTAADSIVGSPTMTADLIDTVLARAKSPAQGLGPALYSLGVQYGINPAYALAFFHHESSYGTLGIAPQTHSLGNIKCTPDWPQCLDGFRSYSTWAAGAADWYKVMHDVYLSAGRETLAKIIPVYAPTADGDNVVSYMQAVRADVARWKQGQV